MLYIESCKCSRAGGGTETRTRGWWWTTPKPCAHRTEMRRAGWYSKLLPLCWTNLKQKISLIPLYSMKSRFYANFNEGTWKNKCKPEARMYKQGDLTTIHFFWSYEELPPSSPAGFITWPGGGCKMSSFCLLSLYPWLNIWHFQYWLSFCMKLIFCISNHQISK